MIVIPVTNPLETVATAVAPEPAPPTPLIVTIGAEV